MNLDKSSRATFHASEPAPIDASLYLFQSGQGQTFDDAMREKFWAEHPVVTNTYRFPTPPVQDILMTAMDAVDEQVRGHAYFGFSGMGKSSLIGFLEAEFEQQKPHIPVFSWEALDGSHSERDFHGTIMEAVGCRLLVKNRISGYAQQVATFFASVAHDRGARQIILIIDEAQNYDTKEWRYLKSVVNLLKKQGLSATTLPFGDVGLHARRAVLTVSEDYDLVNRFMPTIEPFRGLRGIGDIRTVFKWYDTLDFPKGSGVSFSAFFRPERVQAGWTLASEAEAFWKGVCQAVGESEPGIGMEGVALSVNDFLINYRDADTRNMESAVSMWRFLLGKRNIPIERRMSLFDAPKKRGKR